MKKNFIDNLELRKLDSSDLEEFNRLLRYAFQVTDNELLEAGWSNDEIKLSKNPVLEKAQVWGYFEGKSLVSQIALYPMQMNIYGKIYQMGGVTGVATYPEYSKMGLMKNLMKIALKTMRENQQSVSCLYPYSISYYRSRGWEVVSDKMTFCLKDTQLPKTFPTQGRIRRVEIDDRDFIELYDRFARQTHGCLIRDSLSWDEYWRWDKEDEIVAVYYNENEVATGYVVYLLENDIFFIKEMIYLDMEARMGLWNYVKAHESMFNEIQGCNYNNECLSFLLEDSDIKEMIMPHIMARIVDVELFLKDFHFDEIDSKTSLTFEITDSLLEWNNKIITLKFEKDRTSFTQEESKNRVKLDIQTFAAMFLGYRRPFYLKQIGRLEASARAIKILEDVLPEGKVYFSDSF